MARILSAVSGHEEIIDRLLRAREENRLPSTFLFVGPEGVGRRKVALGFAQALVCEKLPIACGECGPCLRIALGQSEALLQIAPEKNQIKIDQSRQIQEFLQLRSMSKARIVILDQAHNLNPQAANLLLKTLEEPPENCYFFLIAPSARHVLPTLRSRSQIVRFGALTEEDLKRNRPAPAWALKSAMGSFTRLQSLIQKDDIELRNEAWGILSIWFEDKPIYLSDQAREWMRDRGALLALTRFWILAFRDGLLFQAGEKDRLMNADQMKGVERLAALDPEALGDLMRRALDLENGLMAQRDPQLSFEEFWIQTRRRVQVDANATQM